MFDAGEGPFAGLLVGSDVLDLASIPDRLAPVRTTLELLRQWDDVVAVLDEITETQPARGCLSTRSPFCLR